MLCHVSYTVMKERFIQCDFTHLHSQSLLFQYLQATEKLANELEARLVIWLATDRNFVSVTAHYTRTDDMVAHYMNQKQFFLFTYSW